MKTSFWQKVGLIVFGIFLTFILLEAGLRLAGFALSQIQEYRNRLALKQQGAYRIMCIGESTTANQYPRFLEERLNETGGGIKFRVIDKGIIGTNTSVIVERLEANLDRYDPQIVIAMMGINDYGQHMPADLRNTGETKIFWKSLRVYKLFEILALNLTTKFETISMARKEDQGRSLPPSQDPVNDSGNDKLQHMESSISNSKPLDEQQQIIQMVEYLQERREFAKEKQFLLDVIKKDPRKAYALDRLGWLCLILGRGPEAVIYLSKSLILNPENNWALKGLGAGYREFHHYASAEAALKKSIAMAPKDDWSYVELTATYSLQGRYESAEALLREGIKRCDRKDTLYGALARINLMTGKKDANPTPYSLSNYYFDVTVRNYRALNSILKRRGVVLVCVQYPMRSLAPLKAIFDDKDHIIFVDNEQIFQSAVSKEGFWEYFNDLFGGDFGHCTDKGNRLLAENITNVILKELIGK